MGNLRFTLPVFLVVTFFSFTTRASQIDKFIDKVCEGSNVSWKLILHEDYNAEKYIDEFEKGFGDLYGRFGKCKTFTVKGKTDGPYTNVKLRLVYDNAYVILKVSGNEKGITGIWYDDIEIKRDSLERIKDELAGLDGTVSVVVKNDKGDLLLSLNQGVPLATGSTFKLFVLRALLDKIKDGSLTWDKVVILHDFAKSLPSGAMQSWGDGSPVTLNTLATQMISISDNTATDMLIDFLGRETIEKYSALNRPFLKTKEIFKLKYSIPDRIRAKYVDGEYVEKLWVLEKVEKYELPDPKKIDFDKPLYLNRIEWFATTDELADIILTMKNEPILSINNGLYFDKEKWKYIGYKGGYDGGACQATYLFENKHGKWFALSATWNNPNAPVNMDKFGEYVTRIIKLLE